MREARAGCHWWLVPILSGKLGKVAMVPHGEEVGWRSCSAGLHPSGAASALTLTVQSTAPFPLRQDRQNLLGRRTTTGHLVEQRISILAGAGVPPQRQQQRPDDRHVEFKLDRLAVLAEQVLKMSRDLQPAG